MSHEIWKDRVRHMIEDIDHVTDFLRGMNRDQFLADLKTIYAVANAFMRLGEASAKIPAETRDAHPEIEWREIRHFRNFVVHVYDQIDATHLWEAAATDLAPLRDKLENALNTEAP